MTAETWLRGLLARMTPGPWGVPGVMVFAVAAGERAERHIALCDGNSRWHGATPVEEPATDAENAHGIVALRNTAEALCAVVEAARLAEHHFHRMQRSGNWQGDDEHEAWAALQRSLVTLDALVPKEER